MAESPLQFYVNHASSPNVTAYGPGLSYGVANRAATFTVFTEDASEGAGASAFILTDCRRTKSCSYSRRSLCTPCATVGGL